jgi:hypothetical protein
MTRRLPRLDRDLAAVVQLLEGGFGDVQVLEVTPNPPVGRSLDVTGPTPPPPAPTLLDPAHP